MHPLPFPYVRNLQYEDCDWADDMFETGNAFAVSFAPFYEGCPKCSGKLDVKVINPLITGLNRTILDNCRQRLMNIPIAVST